MHCLFINFEYFFVLGYVKTRDSCLVKAANLKLRLINLKNRLDNKTRALIIFSTNVLFVIISKMRFPLYNMLCLTEKYPIRMFRVLFAQWILLSCVCLSVGSVVVLLVLSFVNIIDFLKTFLGKPLCYAFFYWNKNIVQQLTIIHSLW